MSLFDLLSWHDDDDTKHGMIMTLELHVVWLVYIMLLTRALITLCSTRICCDSFPDFSTRLINPLILIIFRCLWSSCCCGADSHSCCGGHLGPTPGPVGTTSSLCWSPSEYIHHPCRHHACRGSQCSRGGLPPPRVFFFRKVNYGRVNIQCTTSCTVFNMSYCVWTLGCQLWWLAFAWFLSCNIL